MRIMKFGGTSVATAERLTTVARLVTARLESEASSATRVVVVASALHGVTDRLAELVGQTQSGTIDDPDGWTVDAIEGLRRHHRALLERVATGRRYRRAAGTIEGRLAALARRLRGVALLGASPAATRDEILAAGERLSVSIVAAALQERSLLAVPVDGGRMIATNSTFGRAQVDAAKTRARSVELMESLPRLAVPVVTGFVAADAEGRTTTLGRGGSDYSASLLAAALDAERVEIWTDVDAIFTAEPHLHPDALPLAELSQDDAEEIAWHGGRVLHRRALEPLAGRDIPLFIRNTLRPESLGTRVAPSAGFVASVARAPDASPVVAARRGLLLLRLRDRTGQGFAVVETVLADTGAEICHRLQTRPDRCLLLVEATDPKDLVRRIGSTDLEIDSRIGMTALAVIGTSDTSPLADTLARDGIAPKGFWAGDRPGSFFAVVDDTDADRAVSSIHGALLAKALVQTEFAESCMPAL